MKPDLIVMDMQLAASALEGLIRPLALIEARGRILLDEEYSINAAIVRGASGAVTALKARIADLKMKKDEASNLVRMLETSASADGSIDLDKVQHFVAAAAAILQNAGDPRRRPLVQLVLRRAVLTDGGFTLTGNPADLAKAVAACRENGPIWCPVFIGMARPKRFELLTF